MRRERVPKAHAAGFLPRGLERQVERVGYQDTPMIAFEPSRGAGGGEGWVVLADMDAGRARDRVGDKVDVVVE